jgi:hypothetical protein
MDITNRLETLSNSILTLNFAVQGIVIIVIAFFVIIIALFFLHSYYKNALLARSAGNYKRLPVILVSITETFGRIAGNFLILLPILAGVILASGLALGVVKSVASVSRFIEREKQIKALSIAINFLNQSDKVLDVRVRSVQDDVTTVKLDYKASSPGDTSVPPVEWTKTLSIPGTELHFDSIVFNFSYSEIGEGRQRNIAIPYRVFSNSVAAKDGVKLFEDATFIQEEDDYGLIPQIYRDQLAKLLTDAAYAKEMGIRSVNGSDIWRAGLKEGDHFRISIQQTGGLTIEVIGDK